MDLTKYIHAVNCIRSTTLSQMNITSPTEPNFYQNLVDFSDSDS